jgi:hypothetical protein
MWSKILKFHPSLFVNRKARDLKKKYHSLKNSKNNILANLKQKACLLDESEFKIEQTAENSKYIRW